MFKGNAEYRDALREYRDSNQRFVRKFSRSEKRAIEREINPHEYTDSLPTSGMHDFYNGIVYGDWLLVKAVRYYATQVADSYKQMGDFEKASDIIEALNEYSTEFPD